VPRRVLRSVLLPAAVLGVLVAVVAGVLALGGRVGGTEAAAAPHPAAQSAPAALPTVVVHLSPRQRGAAADPASVNLDRARAGSRPVSRSEDRSAVDASKKRALDQKSGGQVTRTEDRTPKDPRAIARLLLRRYGFGAGQFSCLNSIYVNESGWKVHADNPSSSAYGIPQALPGSKMASAGRDWHDNPMTQIRWGLGYIKARYGSPCGAWSFKQGHGWY
jgi:hypothetical protein